MADPLREFVGLPPPAQLVYLFLTAYSDLVNGRRGGGWDEQTAGLALDARKRRTTLCTAVRRPGGKTTPSSVIAVSGHVACHQG